MSRKVPIAGKLGVLFLVCLAIGLRCATPPKSPGDRLREAVDAYNHAFRWRNYERAVAYVSSAARASFLATYEDDDPSLQIEDWSVTDVAHEREGRATVSVKVRYMLLPSVTVESRTVVQRWAETDGEWRLDGEDNPIVQPKTAARVAPVATPPHAEPSTRVEVERVPPDAAPIQEPK